MEVSTQKRSKPTTVSIEKGRIILLNLQIVKGFMGLPKYPHLKFKILILNSEKVSIETLQPVDLKRLCNQSHRQNYRKVMMSDEMREKIKEYDRKKAAKYRLVKKLESENRKKANNTRKCKVDKQVKFQLILKNSKICWQDLPSGYN